jgi:O-antigen ligase
MAGSRGPWMGTLFSYPLIPISASKKFFRNLLLYGLAVVFVYGVVFNVLDAYTAGGRKHAENEQQEAAAYRRELIANYTPIVQMSPVVGWGAIDFPKVKGMESIDNAYLLLVVTQGFVGLTLFSLLCIRASWRLTWIGMRTKSREERVSCFTLLAVLIGIMASISTVFLGMQVQQIFFLVLGWAEAMGRKDRREVLRLSRVIA